MKKILKNRKIYWTALLCMLLLLGRFPAAVYGYERMPAAGRSGNTLMPGQFEIIVEYGWKGMSRGSSEVPAAVTVVNNGSEFHGTLKLCIPMTSDAVGDVPSRFLEQLFVGVRSAVSERSQTYTYELPVDLPKNGTVRKELTVALIDYNATTVIVSLEDPSGTKVYEKKESISTENLFRNEVTVGVLETEEQYASGISGTEVGNQGYVIRAVSIRPEDLTAAMAEAGAPDVLILLDYSRGALEENQLRNLERWEAGGGVAIDFENMFSDIGEEAGEAGAVLKQIFRENPEKILQLLLTEEVVSNLISVRSDSYIESFDNAFLLEEKAIRKQPSSILFLVLIAGYAVLAGPALYLLLKKKHKRYYLWTGICSLSVVFVLLICVLGHATSMGAPVIAYRNVLSQSGSVLEETLDFEVQAPYNDGYTIYLDSAYRMTPGSSQNVYSAETQGTAAEGFEQIRLFYGEGKNKITISNQPSFALNAFTLFRENTMDTDGLVSDLVWEDKKVSGTISNQTAYTLKDCVLMLPGHMAYVGDLKAGETLEVSGLETTSVRGGDEWLRLQFGEGNRTRDFASQLNLGSLNRVADSILLAEVTDKEETFQLYSGYETCGTVLYKANASVTCLNADGVLSCPYAQQYYSTDQDAFSYSKYPDSLIMDGQELEVTYFLNAVYEEAHLWERCFAMLLQEIFVDPEIVKNMESEMISSNLEYIRTMMEDPEGVLSLQKDLIVDVRFEQPEVLMEDWAAFDGKIEVYNYGTGAYEELENWELTDSSVEKGIPSPYLRNGNQLKIRYSLSEENLSSEYYQKMRSYQMPDLIVTAVGADNHGNLQG